MIRAALLAMAMAAGPASAQKVYRCGPDGREFSQLPCKTSQTVDAADPRTAAQREQAQANARRNAQLAEQLEQERHQREAAASRVAGGFHPARPASAASAPAKTRKAKKPKPAASPSAGPLPSSD